jgi:hypothetical protein
MRSAPAPNGFDLDEVAKLFRGFSNNDPGAWKEFNGPERASMLVLPAAVQRRLYPPDGRAVFDVGPKIHAHIESYIIKLTKALYYKHFGQIVPTQTAVEYSAASNAEIGEPRERQIASMRFSGRADSCALVKWSNKSPDLRSVPIFLSRQRPARRRGVQDPLPPGFHRCVHRH